MAVPYAYLGFKATNKSKRKPEMELFSNSVFFVEREKYVMKDIYEILARMDWTGFFDSN